MFPISPGVAIREIDASAVVQELAPSNGVFAGKFAWGPVLTRTRISDEGQLTSIFGKPTDENFVDFFTASSFLAYSNALDVVRIGSDTASFNANDQGLTTVSVLNDADYDAGAPAVTFLARYPGALGNGLKVYACGSANQYQYALPGTFAFTVGKTATYTPADDPLIAGTLAETLSALVAAGDKLVIGGVEYTVASVSTNTVTFTNVYVGSTSVTTATKKWKYADLFGSAPAANEMLLVVVDELGKFAEAGATLESFRVSLTAGAKNDDGSDKFYKTVLQANSSYILAGSTAPTFGTGDNLVDVFTLTGGADTFASLTTAAYIAGYDLFKDRNTTDAAFIIAGDALSSSYVLGQYLIQNIAENRKDSIVFLSPKLTSITTDAILTDRAALGKTSYGFMDSGWKLMYDRYNNKNRLVPLNGDAAGTYALVDKNLEAWYSAGGRINGRIKNAIRLQFNPSQSDSDRLYVGDVNPVISTPGVGPYINGDKTLLGASTAFNRMNVRRLFIVIEKSIATAAEQLLFQFNDEFTQRRFISIVEPFLRDIKGRRGLEEFLVIADASVNTPQVVQQNRFVGQIFIKPLYSINFIRLDFVAVNASTSFEEVIVGG
jgi:hypothetical protein